MDEAIDPGWLGAATEAVLRAGAIQKQRYGTAIEIAHKGEIDLVTEVDHACEAAIVALLRERFPDHDIVTEESDLERRGGRHVWYVDPLDGTTNFAHGYPFFCASVALSVDGAAVAGAVYDPIKAELFTGERGGGARLNGRPLRVTDESDLNSSLLITGFPYDVRDDLERNLRAFQSFVGQARAVRRDGAAALDVCYVAAGRADAFWEERLHPWDVLAAGVVLEEAGGRVTRFDGAALDLRADQVLATNGALHAPMQSVLREVLAAR